MRPRPRYWITLRALWVAAAMAGASVGCSTTYWVRVPGARTYTDAVYQETLPFYFYGLVGNGKDYYVDKLCLGKEADQVATEHTASDVLISVITLGIYTPKTVKIWCRL